MNNDQIKQALEAAEALLHALDKSIGPVVQLNKEPIDNLRAALSQAEPVAERQEAQPQDDFEHYAALEREHFGDPDKRTGIYAAPDAQPQEQPKPVAEVNCGDDGFFATILPGAIVEVGQSLYSEPFRQPEFKHPDDAAVDRFAIVMKDKLTLARAKGRGGWDNEALCTVEHLSNLLREHVEKGDPVDVANFCMMLQQRGSGITRSATSKEASAYEALKALAKVEAEKTRRIAELEAQLASKEASDHIGEANEMVGKEASKPDAQSDSKPAHEVCCNHCGWVGMDADLTRALAVDEPDDDVGDVCPKCRRIGDLMDLEAAQQAPHSPADAAISVAPVGAQQAGSRDAVLEEAAKAVTDHDRKGREWVPGSLWDTLSNEAAQRIRALKGSAQSEKGGNHG